MFVDSSFTQRKGKALKTLLLIISFILLSPGLALTETVRTLSEKNEYGGITKEIAYMQDEEGSGMFVRIVSYFDGNDRQVKLETYSTAPYALEKGFDKMTVHYRSDRKKSQFEYDHTDVSAGKNGVKRTVVYLDDNEKMIRSENFSTEKFVLEKGTEKVTIYYDGNEKETKAEYSYAGKTADEKGFDGMIIYFDDKGSESKMEYYKNKNLIQTLTP